MKYILTSIFTLLLFTSTNAQDSTKKKLVFNPSLPVYTVEATCGNCMYKMEGTGCNLAVKFNDKNYFVKGTNIDDHGDAHDADGFCNAIKKARVQGSVIDDKFVVSFFELVKNK